ncbi:MAG: NAD(P)/FAD-dependent oxidoreductase [Lachnospiraceae bacterium]|nr:NAD(P)/FAD-dependent oxidoreductase [Lachnospiraceae bacterium]
MSDIIVVGGGASGMMAAVAAADLGHKVVLLEQNEKLGKKLFITGKGRCNVTNNSDVENHLAHVVSNPKFLYSAFYSFDSRRMMDFLEMEGLALKTERGNRVFPASDKSSDVLRTLQQALQRRGVDVRLHTRVEKLLVAEGQCEGVICECHGRKKSWNADSVILATGGLSYSATGSTGDGHRFLEQIHIPMTPCYPALVPVETKEEWAADLQGLSLRNVALRVYRGKKQISSEQGEMLFTHYGVSGPLVLSASSLIGRGGEKDCRMEIDLKPALSEEQMDERLQRDFEVAKNSQFKNSLGKLLPAKLIPVMVTLSGIPPEKRVNEITREERKKLGKLCKALSLTVKKLRGFDEAIITGGGVSVKAVNPATMELKEISNLHVAGELLDLDAVTGGYNLQIAWSTGYLAGISAVDTSAADISAG